MNNVVELNAEEKLKLAVFHTVSKLCKSVAEDNKVIGPYSFSKDAIELIAEVIWKKLEVFSEDVEAFAKNRKQFTVNVDDVKLLVRRNPSLKEHITQYIGENISEKVNRRKKSKEPVPSTSTGVDVIEID